MNTTSDITTAAATLGRKGGKSTSEAKTAAAKANGAKGGRPRCEHAVAWIEVNYGRHIRRIVSKHKTESAARTAAERKNKSFRKSNPNALCGYEYARLDGEEWLLDGQE